MRVQLGPVDPAMDAALRDIEVNGCAALTGRFSGQTPSPRSYGEALWASVVEARSIYVDGHLVGAVAAYDLDPRSQTVWLAAFGADRATGRGSIALAAATFVDELYDNWPIRKVYLDIPEYNMSAIASGLGSHLEVEAEFPGQYTFSGRQWSRLIVTSDRGVFLAAARPLLRGAASVIGPLSSARKPSFEAFVEALRARIDDVDADVRPETRLVADLAIDSLGFAILALWLEQEWDIDLDPDGHAAITVGDLFAAVVSDARLGTDRTA